MAKVPLHLILGQIFAHLSGEVIEPVQCAGMKEGISRLPEHGRNLVVVVGHQLWFGGLLGECKQAVDVLNSLECFLMKTEWKYNNQWQQGLHFFPSATNLIWGEPVGTMEKNVYIMLD